ncbi:Ig-like domain-containing protein [Lacisediminihabitans sp.]|uniref:Ig-like domain-containing protein n=1 Tax=Lacisediminihabitans sp. TaxID=2787631 RepID=UPI00374D533F
MFRQWLGSHKSLVATATSGTVIAALLATVAIVSTGYTAQRLDLGDGSVWVANGTKEVIGRANTQVLALNTVVASTGANIDVVQNGTTVLLFDHSNAKVDVVDPATSKVLDSVPLPPQNPQLFLAGDNVVVGSGGTGEFWILPVAQLPTFSAQTQPTLSLGADTVASITPEGVLYAFSRAAHQVYRVDAAHGDTVDQTNAATFGDAQSTFSISSAGGRWAVLDSASRILHTAAGSVDLATEIAITDNPVLQQPTASGDAMLVGYSGGLLRVPFDGGDPVRVETGKTGFAAAPMILGGCTFAAWSGGGAWRKCGTDAAETLRLPSVASSSSRLAFEANGGNVVLNDPRGGATWAVQQGGELINNWSELITVKQDQQQVDTNQEDTPPNYEKAQVPPVAVNDAFGARPARTSMLPVLLNDYDANGDVLVITAVTAVDENVGRVDIINNGQQLQVTLSPAATGTLTFGYTISDGRGGSAGASVTVTTRSPNENSPPEQVRQTKAIVAQGGRVTVKTVLGDWVDPDGDAFYLSNATTEAPDRVSYKPEGSVVFTEGGASGALRSVSLVVSDGRATGAGSLTVTVKPAGQVSIITDPFVVPAYAGQEVTVSPLEHVRGGSGTLRLASVPAKTGATIVASLEAGTFRFSSTEVGTHYLEYVVNDGDQTATGEIRVEVAAPPDANSKPITIPKTIFVKTLSSQTIDVASTDIDPGGAVLLVTGVYNIAANAGIRAEVIEQRAIRVTLVAPLESGPVSFNYRVSNGLAESEGIVTVVEIPVPSQLQPPIANDDAVTVRVGDAIDIPVLNNDVQPDGEKLTLNPVLTTSLGNSSGLLFASGDVLRYLAPQKTGDFTAIYEVSGPDGQVAQAQVKIAVREAVEATNNPPVPVTIVSRVLAGETVRITVPLTGIDPDGDSVQLLGQATSPLKGSVIDVGTDYIDYEAGSYSAGTDSFTYTVIDALGARAVGTVRVGISPKLDGARNPVAIEDEVTTRPGTTVSIQVLANDSDPDGGSLKIIKVEPNSKNIVASIVGDIVKVTPPSAPGTYGLVYTIQNAFGGTSSNFITVKVDPNAPRAHPVVSDTVLTLADILGRETVDVNVLAKTFFADGNANTLKVSLLPGYDTTATVTSNKRIRVSVQNKSQIIPFAVVNPDDSKVASYAFVWVPGLDDALPQLNRKAPPLTVASESTLTIDLADYVLAIGGKKVHLTDSTSVQATHANGDPLVVNDHTLRFTSADKYFGPASISFTVTDGDSTNDPAGHVATLVLPIKVTARANQPPSFVGGVIDFEPGESKVLDLVKLTNYPYPKDVAELAYTVLSPLPDGFSYTLADQTLTIRANEGVPKNSSTSILLGVRDALAAGQSGRIELNVVASTRPLAKPAPDSVLAQRGQTTTVDVLANDEATNPFPGKPLTVVAIRGLDGGQLPAGMSISPSPDKRRLTITVASSASPGDTGLQYQVADATGDPDRYVWGSVRVSVQDRPDPVVAVQATAFGDRKITLRWSAGAANNSPITGFDVLEYSPSLVLLSTTPCAAAICDIATPGNGPDNAVRLRVVAKNAIGASDPAGLDATVWSDIVPGAPATVGADPLDGGLSISWTKVTTGAGGSPVNSYHVTAGSRAVDVDLSACSGSTCTVDVNGLTNGQTVPVSVSARNSAYAPLTTWNSSGTSASPAGVPLVVSAPTAAAVDTSISLDWDGVFTDNGRPITGYTAVAYTGAAPTCAKPNPPGSTSRSVGTATSTTFTGLSSEANYSLVVFATNKIGCAVSAAVTAHTSPGVITAVSTTGPSQTGNVFNFILAGASSGSTDFTSDYSFFYRLVTGGTPSTSGAVGIGGPLTATSLYGKDVSVQLRACRSYGGTAAICQSQWSASFHLGTPVDPRVSSLAFALTGDGVIDQSGTFTWANWPVGDYEAIQYRCGDTPGGTWQTATAADLSEAGQCQADGTLGAPTLDIRVVANGNKTYDITYDTSGKAQ